MRIPKSEFADADLKLCRAHGASVAQGLVMTASQPHDDAEWSRLWDRAEAIATFETTICMPSDPPLPPSYWDDLEHWLKSLAPAKPAAPQPHRSEATATSVWRSGPMIPRHERVGLWHVGFPGGASRARVAAGLQFDNSDYRQAAHGTKEGDPYDESKYATAEPAADGWHSEAPSVPGVYIADTKECVAESSERASRWLRYFDGVLWSNAWRESMSDIDKARTKSLRTGADIMWLRLIEADAPAARLASTSSADGAALVGVNRPAVELQRLVCVAAHVCQPGNVRIAVGQVSPGHMRMMQRPECWLPCDKDGWIPHTPTADSTCPVPDGVGVEVKLRTPGYLCPLGADEFREQKYSEWWRSGYANDPSQSPSDIVAWRPIAKDAS